MPFHQRTLEPARLRRPEAAVDAGAPLFRSLEQVSSHALVCLLAQLADLSRCAGDIFGELESQAAALGRRAAALHRRLDALHTAAARLDHRRVKIQLLQPFTMEITHGARRLPKLSDDCDITGSEDTETSKHRIPS